MSNNLLFFDIWISTYQFYRTLICVIIPVSSLIYWIKIRTSYFLKNWIYTTNHKKIAMNYFLFIYVAGTAGMGLATVIRLEFAYPGAGIFAGDSLQYLTMATAHGVIMVFFMIMPVLFGAFGNFLLPTQMGVHDVAFPRLNSAAFWFLPGGLLMLAQLVCTERRYQRLNCFNMRELQSVLKRKYFFDLINSNDHHEFLNNAMVGFRYKMNGTSNINTDITNFYNFGTTFTAKTKNENFINNYQTNYISNMGRYINFDINNIFEIIRLLSTGLISVLKNFNPTSLYSFYQAPAFFLNSINNNLNTTTFNKFTVYKTHVNNDENEVNYNTEVLNTTGNFFNYSGLELNNSLRFTRYYNPLISFAPKSGNYIGLWEKLYPSLMTTFIEITLNVIKASWMFSDDFSKLLLNNYKTFNKHFNSTVNINNITPDELYINRIQPIYNYFNFNAILNNDNYINTRWISVNALNQKFSKMFTSSSTKQRILANWRQLKFTREAWRCKLLAVRHQNTLYRRFLNEDSLVWSMDRNAKDLLPGWAMVTPFSARTRYTAVGKTDVGLMGVLLVLNASIISGANFLVTYRYLSTLNNRKMRDARSFFTESIIVASWMMLAANPMLVIAIIMLLFDRHWQTSFFDYSGGGDTVLFQHMFWFFGHPEVYIIIIPVFGFTNTIISYTLRKRISARSSLLYSMYTIAFLGFFVWGHHMYMVGLAHTTRMLFSTLTVMISVPAATKLMHWSVTLVNSFFTADLPLVWAISFVYFFTTGGVSGMCVAHTGMDVLFHDTFYVIGHFHIMLAGAAMMGIFGGYYFYFPALHGVKYSRVYAYIHYWYYLIGQILTSVPMLFLGYCGMPRRVLDYPSTLGGWHALATAGHFLSVIAILSFFLMIYDSLRQAKPTVRNTFGIARFNTRLNFYIFEINRLSFIQNKSFYNNRFYKNTSSNKTELNLLHLSNFDTTLFSYKFFNNK